jgi:hypothetical protein
MLIRNVIIIHFPQHLFAFLSPVGPDILLAYPILKHPLQKDWGIFRQVGKISVQRLLVSFCLFARMEQFGSHWTDFH